MALTFSMLAVLAAAAAIVWSWRARAASHRLALEMVHLRERLARAESAREAAEARAAQHEGAASSETALARRVGLLEERLQEARSAEAANPRPPEEEGEDVRGLVERHLRAQGYERVVVLGPTAPDGVPVEVERAGVTSKGRARVAPDGTVRLRSVSSVRAFP
jgi:hypothetical protein